MTQREPGEAGPAPDDMTAEERIAFLEERLARVNRRFRFMVEAAPDGLLLVHKEQKAVLLANPAFSTLVGEEPTSAPEDMSSRLLGLTPLENYIDARHWPAIAETIEQQVRGEMGELTRRADVVHQETGERIPCELTFHKPQVESRAAAVFVRDLRERLEAQRQIQDYSRTLEARNRELRETQSQLVHQGKMASLGALVAGVAHDINTPLGSIKSSAELVGTLCERLETGGASQLPRLLALLNRANATIATASKRIDQSIRSLRSFARLDESELKRVDLREGIDTAVRLAEPSAEGRVKIVRRFGEIPELTVRAGEINQVLLNLITNAIQAIEGSGTVTVTTRTRDGEAQIAIADTGRGIAPEHRALLFDPGFTTKGVGVGTGLGLSIADRIVREHGGRIDVESELGVGSTFTLCLPVHESEEIVRRPHARIPDMRLVDTHFGMAATLRASLETGLLRRVTDGPVSADELAAELELDPRATARVLEVLLAGGYLDWIDGRYAPNPTTALLVATRSHGVFTELWAHLPVFLKTGACIQLPHGSGVAEREASYAQGVSMLNELFDAPSKGLAERLSPRPGARVLDVGCGSGVWSLAILDRHEEVMGVGLDFPRVLERYRAEAAARGLEDRVSTVAGDMYDVPLEDGAHDVILIANVVHLEPESRLEPLFRRLLPALQPDGELIVVDAIHDRPSCAAARAVYALHLSMRVAEGVVHSPAVLHRALTSAGLGYVSVIELAPEVGAFGALRATRRQR